MVDEVLLRIFALQEVVVAQDEPGHEEVYVEAACYEQMEVFELFLLWRDHVVSTDFDELVDYSQILVHLLLIEVLQSVQRFQIVLFFV